jgi:uncharacterized protein
MAKMPIMDNRNIKILFLNSHFLKEMKIKNKHMKTSITYFILLFVFLTGCNQKTEYSKYPEPLSFNDIKVKGRLKKRAEANSLRLERGRYLPDSIYLIPNPEYHQTKWPGDLPGRLVLGQTLLEQATHRKARYLREILDEFPEHMNEKGYFGKIYEDKMNEQQLSGHGWALRGLCEHYQYSKDQKTKALLEQMVKNLVLPTKGMHKNYPIDPGIREEAGSFMGTHLKEHGKWILSTDIGCDFIFMDGVVHAYEVLQTEDLKQISEEMINRFLETDLAEIEAQTHATLTALRAILRYYKLSGDEKLLTAVEDRFKLYKSVGMTENYENYNWFGRPRWTEPCAVIDSYIVAMQLWQFTGKPEYLADAQLIYYNGIGSEQRFNGGFGCNTCCGNHDPYTEKFTDPFVRIATTESHWCCTMRGGEGLARAIEYSYFTHGDTIIIPNFRNNTAQFDLYGNSLKIDQKTDYPFRGKTEIKISESAGNYPVTFKIFIPGWVQHSEINLNNKKIEIQTTKHFAYLTNEFKSGDIISIRFDIQQKVRNTLNPNSIDGYKAVQFGPLIIGRKAHEVKTVDLNPALVQLNNYTFLLGQDTLTTLNHMMDPSVTKENNFSFQMLFEQQ